MCFSGISLNECGRVLGVGDGVKGGADSNGPPPRPHQCSVECFYQNSWVIEGKVKGIKKIMGGSTNNSPKLRQKGPNRVDCQGL